MASPGEELVDLLFIGGIDERTRPEVGDARTSWRTLENGRQTLRGGYTTRPGFTAISAYPLARYNSTTGASTRSTGYKLLTNDIAGTVVIDGDTADSFCPALSASSEGWSSVGRVPPCSLSTQYITPPLANETFTVEDIEECNGFICVLYCTATTKAYKAIYDASNGALVLPPTLASAGPTKSVAVVSYGTYFIIVTGYQSGLIDANYLDTTAINLGWRSVGTIAASNFSWSKSSPMSVCATDDRFIVAYINTTGPTSYVTVVAATIANPALQTTTVNTATVQPDAIDVVGSTADTIWVSWNQTTTVYVIGLTPTAIGTIKTTAGNIVLAFGSAPNRIGLVMSATAGQGWCVIDQYSGGFVLGYEGFKAQAGAVVSMGANNTYYGVRVAGKPYRVGTRYYVPAYGGNAPGTSSLNDQQICVHVDITDTAATALPPIANILPSLAVTSQYGKGKTKQSPTTTTIYRFGLAVQLNGTSGGSGTGAIIASLDFAGNQRWKGASINGSTYITAGVLSYFDGKRFAEASFMHRPAKPATTTSGTGITAVTGWKYVAVYEETDADGNWHQSGISDPSQSTGAVTNKTVNVLVGLLAITSRQARIAIYRTLDGGNPPYYRVGTVAMVIDGNSGATLTTSTYADTTSDATLSTMPKLYAPSLPSTPGNALDRRPPPGLNHLVVYNGMLVGAEGSNVWYSGQQVFGEGTWFSPIFQVPVEGDGDITGLWVQDGTLIVAKRRAIYAISGDAPSDNGSIGGLGTPRRLSADVGCIDGRSIVSTAKGTFFQSDRGIEIFSRSQDVVWIGEPIVQTTTSFPVCTAATINPVSNLVMIELAGAENANQVSGGGRCAVYDLAAETWVSTDRRTSATGVVDAPAQSACVIYTGSAYRYAWLDTAGYVHVEIPTSHTDSGFWISKRALSGNVKAGSVQGTQQINKVLLLAEKSTASDISMAWANDYSTTRKTARLWTQSEITAVDAALPLVQLELDADDDSRGEAAQIEIVELTPTGASVGLGTGCTWIGLTLERVIENRAFLLPDISR